MFGLFKKKTEAEKLQQQYQKLVNMHVCTVQVEVVVLIIGVVPPVERANLETGMPKGIHVLIGRQYQN